jgi:tetratricopeptide (TPR) repeat protein
MLFDLKGKRKRLVQVVYVGLAILFGGGLVLFGVGGNVSGGLVDAFKGGGGGGDSSAFSDLVQRAEQRAARRPRDPDAQIDVVRANFNLASSTEGSDAETGQLTDRGQQAVIEVAQAWERYLRLKPKKVDPSAASFAALAYGALQDYDKAVETQGLSVKSRPSANGYFQLADFAYRAGQVKTGDRAAAEAVRRTPRDQRNTVRALIKDTKKQGAQLAKALKEAEKAQRKQQRQGGEGGQPGQPGQPGQNFGPLPGAGTTGAGGASP